MEARERKFGRWLLLFGTAVLSISLVACGSSGNSSTGTQTQTGNLNIVMSDASTEDWSVIGVKVLNTSLKPQGGGTPVTVFTASSPAPMINLVQLDQLGEILGNAQVPEGTYTGAVVTVGGNPGDVQLTVANDPETGFAGTPGATIPANQIQIKGTQGSSGSLTVPVDVKFDNPLVVTANQSNALGLEFDPSHPAFIVAHVPVIAGPTIWAVNFRAPLRHRPIRDVAWLVLRHTYGTVTSVATDGSSITFSKDYAVYPPTNPETAVQTSLSLTALADSTNGTLFYDMDAKTVSTLTSFSSLAGSLNGKFVRVAARYQENGTLVAVRVWASSTFNTVWISPEGHVLHVNTATNVMVVENEDGLPIPITVDSDTEFFFRQPQDALADATPIATGTGFLAAKNLVRGFKVHVGVKDVLAVPLHAETVDIELAKYDGLISAPNGTSFVYTRNFRTAADDYIVTLPYISNMTPNGKGASGNQINGFKWWNFAYPTLADTGANAVNDFVSATNGSVNFGGSVPAMKVWGVSYVTWNDPANPNGWSARWTVLLPTPVPLGTVSTAWSSNSNGGNIAMTVPGGANPVTIGLSSVSGSATLVYQVDATNGIVTITPQDLTSASGLANVSAALTAGTPVKAFGVPQADGTIKSYVFFYLTGTQPSLQ
ncbi:MAG TPA: DUF4382 domain-containing protein [Terriglobales bacterium]|nr:DUF4382 domain-containing protein [Terriglobales bacterium]